MIEIELDRVATFKEKLEKLAETVGLPASIEAFMEYRERETQYVPTVYKYLFGAPLVFLAASKSFKKMYEALDADFARDLVDANELRNAKVRLISNQELRTGIKKILGKECSY
jgi:hypothetical protein